MGRVARSGTRGVDVGALLNRVWHPVHHRLVLQDVVLLQLLIEIVCINWHPGMERWLTLIPMLLLLLLLLQQQGSATP